MKALQNAIFQALEARPELTGKVRYFTATLDEAPPYLEYWTGDGARSINAGFREDAREWNIYVQASSRDPDEASAMYEAAEAALNYTVLTVEGWHQRGKIVWLSEIDDPGDLTGDNKVIYYEGATFQVELYRQRTD